MRDRLSDYAAEFVIVGIIALAIGTAARVLGSDPVWLPQLFWAIGIILVASYAVLRPDELREMLTGRQARYGSNAVVASLAVIGIAALVNFLGAQYDRRVDLTETGQYSLSQQSKQILAGLDEPVAVTAFMAPSAPQAQSVRYLLEEYQHVSDRLDYRFVDPDREPALAREYGITSYGVLIFEQGGRQQETFAVDEQSITSAILKVSETESRKVYFTTGHGERSPDQSDGNGYSQVKSLLERDNYVVELLNLQTITDTLPTDADAIVVAGPQVPFAEEEAQLLEGYLAESGKLMVMADPGAETGLESLLGDLGVDLDQDVVVDPVQSFFGDPVTPLVTQFQFHTITKDLGGLTVFFPLARSVSRTGEAPEGASVTDLMQTSSQSWGETNLEGPQAQRDADDLSGPLALATAISGPDNARIVVFGDSDFVSNGILGQVQGNFGNPDLFRNTVNWLAESQELIAIGPKPPENRQIRPLTGGQQTLLLVTLAGLLPLGVLAAGATVWWSRR